MVVAYLSPEWLSAADDALRGSPLHSDQPLVIGYLVRDVPPGSVVRYHISVGPEGAALVVGEATHEHVGFELDHTTALAVAAGRLSAQQAFIDGRLRLTGDAQALLARLDLLSSVDDVLAPIRPTLLDDPAAPGT